MFKKRPRQRARGSRHTPSAPAATKLETPYWERRLFKNTYTYKGRSREVRGWSVKMQLSGKRKTFALHSSDRSDAAAEARDIYQTILTQDWDAVAQRRSSAHPHLQQSNQTKATTASAARLSVEDWRRRLIHRPYPEVDSSEAKREWSVRIEHSGTCRYFPLRTSNDQNGASLAMRIHRTVVEQGWGIANQKYPRELTVALRWLDDPLAWTYTTVHTWIRGDPVPSVRDQDHQPSARNVAIVEPDTGIRYAMAACANRQDGFRCGATYRNLTEASRELTRRKIDLVLVNTALPDPPGSACLGQLQRMKPSTVGLLYSVFEDSDQLFKSAPGGASGYLLRRTPPHRIFDPIAQVAGALTRDLIAAKLREYFQQLVAAIPSGPSALQMAKLTAREHEILQLLAKGDLAKNIANSLGISIWTVHGHVKNIFEKLNVHTRTEAVVKYLQK